MDAEINLLVERATRDPEQIRQLFQTCASLAVEYHIADWRAAAPVVDDAVISLFETVARRGCRSRSTIADCKECYAEYINSLMRHSADVCSEQFHNSKDYTSLAVRYGMIEVSTPMSVTSLLVVLACRSGNFEFAEHFIGMFRTPIGDAFPNACLGGNPNIVRHLGQLFVLPKDIRPTLLGDVLARSHVPVARELIALRSWDYRHAFVASAASLESTTFALSDEFLPLLSGDVPWVEYFMMLSLDGDAATFVAADSFSGGGRFAASGAVDSIFRNSIYNYADARARRDVLIAMLSAPGITAADAFRSCEVCALGTVLSRGWIDVATAMVGTTMRWDWCAATRLALAGGYKSDKNSKLLAKFVADEICPRMSESDIAKTADLVYLAVSSYLDVDVFRRLDETWKKFDRNIKTINSQISMVADNPNCTAEWFKAIIGGLPLSDQHYRDAFYRMTRFRSHQGIREWIHMRPPTEYFELEPCADRKCHNCRVCAVRNLSDFYVTEELATLYVRSLDICNMDPIFPKFAKAVARERALRDIKPAARRIFESVDD